MQTENIIRISILLLFLIFYACRAIFDMDKINLNDNPIFVHHTVFKKPFDWIVLLNFLFVIYVIYLLLFTLNKFIVG